MEIRFPRFLAAAAASGQGKTMLTCALLKLLSDEGHSVRAFKCGPDYIDPMFHSHVLGIPSYNLDSFFLRPDTLRFLLGRHGGVSGAVGVLEGVMGYYDGLSGLSDRASAYEIAKLTKTPVVLIADASRTSLSVLALIRGFLEFRKDSQIAGVIFNRLSPSLYPGLKKAAEAELPVRVLGYVPVLKDISWESRHLGLLRPEEIRGFKEQTEALAEAVGKTIDLEGLMELADSAPPLSFTPPDIPVLPGKPKIAVAMDEAFCFYYRDNLELLEAMGARISYFSPLHDKKLPEGTDGLYLGGGYPELYVRELSENRAMRMAVKSALSDQMPCIAECGGFLYLKEELEDQAGNAYPMAGYLPGRGFYTGKLGRFGYVTVSSKEKELLFGDKSPAHEFHYWDTTENGTDYTAVKPLTGRNWECGFGRTDFYAGFPHFHFYSSMPAGFLKAACRRRERTGHGTVD